MRPSIAVVILNWNGRKLLQTFLPNVIQFSPEGSVFVIDNASDDDSVSYIQTHFPQVTIIQNTTNGGYAKGYNDGLKQIKADIYCLLNSDIEVSKNWLVPIVSTFEQNNSVAVIQPKILDFNNKNHFEYAGAAGGFIDKYGFPFCRGRIFNTIEKDNGQYNDQKKIFWASGACFFVRSEIFNLLNGFDEDFFAHQEEIDFCWRVQQLGKSVLFDPKSVVYHIGGATLTDTNPKKVYLNFRNGLYLLLKNLPKNQLVSIIFTRLILDGIAGIYYLLQGKPKFTWAIVLAHFHFYKNLPYFYRKRKQPQFKTYFLTKSIVYSYFIRKKKYFNNI